MGSKITIKMMMIIIIIIIIFVQGDPLCAGILES
jgi:hypothetical protein